MPSKLTSLGPRLQVAALPWRQNGTDVEVLLITSRLSRHWLIPKGWPMKGKTLAAAAAREALEESGTRGAIGHEPVGRYSYDKLLLEGGSFPCIVEVYPLCVEKELANWPEAATRSRSWMPLETASTVAYEDGLADLLASLDHNVLTSTRPEAQSKKASKR